MDLDFDVVVIGGGSAGVSAAVTAARSGARTLLVERHGFFGGMATASLVHSICGLYMIREESGPVAAHRGFPRELELRLIESGAASEPVRMGKLDVLPVSPPRVAYVLDQVTAEVGGLEVLLHTELVSVENSGNRISEAELITRGSKRRVRARSWVDASGDAVLAVGAGVSFEKAPTHRLQRPAFIFSMHSVEVDSLGPDGRVRLAHQLARAVSDGEVSPGCMGAQVRPSGWGTEVYVTVDLAGGPNFDPNNPSQLTDLERVGRGIAFELCDFWRRCHSAFQRAYVGALPARVGLRESRRVVGRETVTADAVISGADHGDEVAMGTWPMELREVHTGPRWRYPVGNRPTRIPLGALRAIGSENLWVAGRCISCDHEAQAALRVMGTCMATGQAAGLASAMQSGGEAEPAADAIRRLLRNGERMGGT